MKASESEDMNYKQSAHAAELAECYENTFPVINKRAAGTVIHRHSDLQIPHTKTSDHGDCSREHISVHVCVHRYNHTHIHTYIHTQAAPYTSIYQETKKM